MMRSQRLLRDLLLYVPTKLLPAAALLFSIGYCMRSLSPEQYLAYSSGATIVQVAVQLCSGWIAASIVFLLPGRSDREAAKIEFMGGGVAIGALGASLGGACAWIVLGDVGVAAWVAAASLALSLFGTSAALFQAEQRVTPQLAMSLVFSVVLPVMLVVTFGRAGPDARGALAALALGYLGGCCVAALLLFAHVRGSLRRASLRAARGSTGEMMRYGGALSLWAVSMLMLNSGEKFFLPATPEAAAYVSVKDLLIGASSLLSMPLIMVMHPLVFQAYRQGGDHRRLIANSVDLLAIGYGAFWGVYLLVGARLLERYSGIDVGAVAVPTAIAFYSLFLAAAGVYFQKEFEVTSRNPALASTALTIAVCGIAGFALVAHRGQPLAFALVFLAAQFGYVQLLLWRSRMSPWSALKPTAWMIATALVGWGGGSLIGADVASATNPGPVLLGWVVLYLLLAAVLCLRMLDRVRPR